MEFQSSKRLRRSPFITMLKSNVIFLNSDRFFPRIEQILQEEPE